jgi:hypothetical protein
MSVTGRACWSRANCSRAGTEVDQQRLNLEVTANRRCD